MVAIKPTIGLCKRTAGLEEGNRKPKHPLLAAGLRFWPPTLCFRGKLRSFYLFEGMGSFSLLAILGQADLNYSHELDTTQTLAGVPCVNNHPSQGLSVLI